MALTASVIEDTRQPGQAGYVTLGFTAPDSHVFERTVKLGAGVDALQYAIDASVTVERQMRAHEFSGVVQFLTTGRDPYTFPYHVITTEEMRQHAIRAYVNLPHAPTGIDIKALLNGRDFFNQFTSAQVLTYLVGVNTGQVNGFRNWIDGLYTSISTYVPGITEQELDA